MTFTKTEDTMPPEQPDRSELLFALNDVWDALDALLVGLAADQWAIPTCLPGWTVSDVVAHIIGTERLLAGDPFPSVATDVAAYTHVANDIAAANEIWVESLRGIPPAQMLGTLRESIARRREALHGMTQADFDAPSWTPAGQATYGRFMQIRIYDTWMHEQDIRAAVGQPGHQSGPAAAISLAELNRALGYIVGKRAAMPQGTGIRFELTGAIPGRIDVAVDGRAMVVPDLNRTPTVTLRLTSELLLRLGGGRAAAADHTAEIAIKGDRDLAHTLLDNLAFTV
ncbi:maleylpyruvate isomerase family mycothiol-dependent enzyme [Streptomyces sp. 1222.5]|uniref:maleylpyruvate isomerase family mycothiol-dependent enzyme n=1 Tax=Streptomyces sp. 1222.5 TaxID=1881026 RepID=UPI003D75CE89